MSVIGAIPTLREDQASLLTQIAEADESRKVSYIISVPGRGQDHPGG